LEEFELVVKIWPDDISTHQIMTQTTNESHSSQIHQKGWDDVTSNVSIAYKSEDQPQNSNITLGGDMHSNHQIPHNHDDVMFKEYD